jgi:AmpD protein
MDIRNGLLSFGEFIPSPNKNTYPENTKINLLVIHCISLPRAHFGGSGIIELFTNKLNPKEHPDYVDIADLKVSSHLLIRRDGQVIQFVPFTERAWHAGVSTFGGRSNCNDFSLGIELEGTDDTEFTDEQYQALAKVTKSIRHEYPRITPDRIVGHSDIAPGRKTDPGIKFDWQKYRNLLD